MALRDFVLNNLRWKLTALLLAMLVWFVIKFKEPTGGRNQALTQHAVMVLKSPEDPRIFRIQPRQVDLEVQGSRELHPEDLEVFVDLTTLADVDSASELVQVRGADAAKVISITPERVRVERLTPANGNRPTTSNLTKP